MSTLWGPPANLRLVVIDLETVRGPDRKDRIAALGAVVCRGRVGALGRQLSWLVDPGCPVDEESQRTHHLTDDDLADAPTFGEVWADFAPLLAPARGETVVLAAHYCSFDIPILRREVARAGHTMPDLPLLDTWGKLADIAGLTLTGRRLPDVLAALGLTNAEHHNALADATATARAARVLLERAEERGQGDLAALLDACGDGRTGTVKPTRRGGGRLAVPEAPPLPETHLERHGRAWKRTDPDADWISFFGECAALRCDGLAAHAETMHATVFRRILFDVLGSVAARKDGGATATVLGALVPVLGTVPKTLPALRAEGPRPTRLTGQSGRRGTAAALAVWLDTLLAGVPRCPDDEPCPSCRDGLGCPRDTWPAGLAPAMFEPTARAATGYWNTRIASIDEAVRGTPGRAYLTVQAALPALADAGLRAACAFWREQSEPETALAVADQAWRQGGCRDPEIAVTRAMRTAAAGRPADIAAAIADCHKALALRARSTDPAWDRLESMVAALDGRLARLEMPAPGRPHPRKPPPPPRPAPLQGVGAQTR